MNPKIMQSNQILNAATSHFTILSSKRLQWHFNFSYDVFTLYAFLYEISFNAAHVVTLLFKRLVMTCCRTAVVKPVVANRPAGLQAHVDIKPHPINLMGTAPAPPPVELMDVKTNYDARRRLQAKAPIEPLVPEV